MFNFKFNFIKKVFYIFVYIIIFILTSCNSKKSNGLRIAYTNDIAGIIINSIKNDASINIKNVMSDEYIDFGDCCGSYAQFAFANNQLDVAVLCTDAYNSLKSIKDDYEILGYIVKNSDVLIYNNLDDIKTIAYMNKREEQVKLLKNIFDDVVYAPITPNSIPYALEGNIVDAAVVDVSTYMKLNYKMKNISDDAKTEMLVIKKSLLNDIRLKKFIKVYNDKIKDINSSDAELLNLLKTNLKLQDNDWEILNKWRKTKVVFQMLKELE